MIPIQHGNGKIECGFWELWQKIERLTARLRDTHAIAKYSTLRIIKIATEAW
jgi:hypothetical protein